MLNLILEGIRAVGFERVRLYLLSADGTQLVGETHVGMDDDFVGAEWPVAAAPFFGALLEDPRPRLFAGNGTGEGPAELPLDGDAVSEWACAPLSGHEVKGMIAADNKQSRTPISEEMLSLLSVLASQVPEAIALAGELDAAQMRAAQLEALERITLAITSNIAPRDLLNVIIKYARQLLSGQSCGIYEYYPERKELVVAAAQDRPDHVGKVLKVGEGMAGRLVLNAGGAEPEPWDDTIFRLDDGTPFRATDDYNEWPGRADIYATGRAFEAVIEVPLKWQNKVLGVLYVDDYKGRHFTRDDAQLLKRFADHAAIAMTNAALLGKDKAKLRKLERLSEVMKEMMSDLGEMTLEERLNHMARYAVEILQAEVCGVFLVKEPDVLTLEASYGHREGGFKKGRKLPIRTGVGTGLTGHIAAEGKLFNENGEELTKHPAVRGVEPDCTPTPGCTSLLAIPLTSASGGEKKLLGLIRVSNKTDEEGRALPTLRFVEEDEWVLTIFADAVVTAIEGASLVNALSEHKDKLLRMISSSPSCIIAADRKGNITELNEQARVILGYGPDDKLPSNISEIFFGEAEARRVGGKLHEAKGRLEKYDVDIQAKDKGRVPIRLSATWLFDAAQERVGSVGYFEDRRPQIVADKRLNLVLEANRIVATAESPRDGLQNLAEKLLELLNNSFCRILLLDESGQYLSVEAAYPVKRINWKPGRGQRIALAEYQGLKQFLKNGPPTVLRWTDDEYRPMLEKFSRWVGLEQTVKSLLMVPLRLGDEVVGLLDVGELRDDPQGAGEAESAHTTDRRMEPFTRAFTKEKIEVVTSVAAQTGFLIERIRRYEATKRRSDLLERLDETARGLRSISELDKLYEDVARLAVQLLKGGETMASALFVNCSLPRRLEPKSSYGLAEQPTGQLRYEDGPIGEVAKTGDNRLLIGEYSVWAEREGVFTPEYGSMIAVPLRHSGETTHVLALADSSGSPCFGKAEVEALERFAAQAAIALKTAEILSPEQRKTAKRLDILHQITEYILSEEDFDKMLNVVLTGITAGYGLGFNRAALFLLDEASVVLEGRQGIGHFEKKQAEDDWKKYHSSKQDTFRAYVESLKQGPVALTPVGEWVRDYRLPVSNDGSGFFKRAVTERQWFTVAPEHLTELPRDFLYGFKPTTTMVVIPLHAREKSVGVLVVDNKFNKSVISPEDVESLMTYANTVALAIDNLRLLRRLRLGSRKMQLLFEAGTRLRTTSDPERVLLDIVELTHKAADADWVRIILIDEMRRPHALAGKGDEDEPPLGDLLRPGGISETVMLTGEYVKIENTHRADRELHPDRLSKGAEALLCLPLAMQGRKFGVMWIGHKSPRVFHEIVINALQLYVNQAAVAYDSARRMEELEQMRQAAEALADADDPQAVLDQIVKSAHAALRADSAAIWTYDDVRDQFDPESWVSSNIEPGLKEDFWKAQPRFGGTAHTVMKKGLISVRDLDDAASYGFLGDSTRRLLGRIGVRSFLGLALTAGDERLGVLYVNYNRPRSFTDEEAETARSFANHAALALKRARLLEQVRKAKKAAEAVAKVTVVGDHERTLREIVRETKAALDCDAVVLFVFDKTKNSLRHPPYMHGVEHEEEARRDEHELRDSIVYTILNRPETEFIEKADEAPLTARRRFREDEGIKSVVGIPLRAGGEKVGVMFVNYRRHHRFTDEERANIELFANQTAVAIRNAQLFEQQQRRQNDLLDLSRKLLGTNRLDETMQAAVDSAAEMLGAEFCAIVLPAEEGAELVFRAAHGWDEETLKGLKLRGSHGSQTGFTMDEKRPVVVEDFHEGTVPFKVHPIVRAAGIRSSVSVPMFENENVIGAIIVHSRQTGRFGTEEVSLLTLIANQTAVAMHSARQFEEVSRRRRNLDALYDASRAIAISFRPDPDLILSDQKKVLDEITRQAVTSVTGQKPTLGTIQLYDDVTKEIVFRSVYPPDKYAELVAKHGERNSLLKDGRPWGVVAEVIRTGEQRLIPDVSQCDYYIEYDADTLSELTVPLIIEGKVRGALNVESNKQAAFDNDDVTNLLALAELAAAVIRNGELFDELIKAKGIADSSRTLAKMSIVSGIWRHTIQGHAVNIKNLLTLTRTDVSALGLTPEQAGRLEERLSFIQNMTEKILHKEGLTPFSSDEKPEVMPVNDLIRERVAALWKTDPWAQVEADLRLADEGLKIRVSPDLFRRAFDILVDNAVEAMKGRAERRLTVATRRVKREIEISFTDTGVGVPPEKEVRLFEKPVNTEEGKSGFGVGLLFARLIVETYSGTIKLKETGSHGTTFVINLPSVE